MGGDLQAFDQDLAGRASALLDAVAALGSDLDLGGVLSRIVRSACEITGARYGFLGVLGPEGTIDDFALHGITAEQVAAIPTLPKGLGILGLIIDEPQPLRLARLSEHPQAYGFPPNHPPMNTFLGVPVRVRDTVFGNLYLTEKHGGGEFTDEDEALVLTLARAAGNVIENARAFAVSERRRRWLEASLAINEALQGPVRIDDARTLIVQQARMVTGAALTVLVERDGADFGLVGVDGGDDDNPGEEWAVSLIASVGDELEAAASSGEPVVTSRPTGTVLLVPFHSPLASHGVLAIVHPTHLEVISGEERPMLMGFAQQAALALDQARSQDVQQQLLLAEDRGRIARDLHDLVIQRLFAMGLQLQSVRHLSLVPEVQRQIDETVRDLDATIRNIRATIFQLEDSDFPSLRKAAGELAREYTLALGFRPQITTQGSLDGSVPREVANHLLATLREGLANVAKHAGASLAEIEIIVDDGTLLLRISDDGRGVPDTIDESGLRNAARRATSLGGRLRLGTRPGGGAQLEWEVPL